MNVRELSKDQKMELKQNVLLCRNKNASWQEIADADILVPDSELEELFEGVEFTEEDFFCNL